MSAASFKIAVQLPSWVEDVDRDVLQDEMLHAMERVVFAEQGVIEWDDFAFYIDDERANVMDLKLSTGRSSILFQGIDMQDEGRLLRIVRAAIAEAKEGYVVSLTRVEGPYSGEATG